MCVRVYQSLSATLSGKQDLFPHKQIFLPVIPITGATTDPRTSAFESFDAEKVPFAMRFICILGYAQLAKVLSLAGGYYEQYKQVAGQ